MKILLINHYAGSDEHGMEYRPFYIARELNKKGHQVDIIASSFSHLRRKNPEVKDFCQKERIENVDFYWLGGVQYQGNGLARVLSMLVFVLKLFLFIPKLPTKYDAVVASSTYPLDIFPAWLIAKLQRAKLAFEIHDLWPLSPMELGGYSKWHPFIILMQLGESFALRFSDKVISILPDTLEHCKAHGMKEEKFVHVPNGVLLEEWEGGSVLPEEHAKVINELKKQGRFIAGYAGSFGIANSLDTILDAAKIDKETTYVLVGNGPEKRLYQDKIRNENIENVLVLPSVPKKSIPALLREFDALIITLQKQPLFRFGVSPNKLFDYMMAGKPVVCVLKPYCSIVDEGECGISADAESSTDLAIKIRELKSLPKSELNRMGKNGQSLVGKKYNYKLISANFVEAFEV